MRKFYTSVILLIFFLFIQGNLSAQNLVQNPSFETVSPANLKCSWYLTNTEFAAAISNWTAPTAGSTDLFHSSLATSCFCSPFSTDPSSPGTQAPRTGSSMSAMFVYGNGGCSPYREYLQGSLSSPLVVGQQYCIEFYVSLADYSTYACNNIGLYFTNAAFYSGSMCVYSVTPQVNYTGIITNKTAWTLISLTYTATAPYTFFTIGNFYNDAATTTTNVGGSISQTRYFIDDVDIHLCSTLPVITVNSPTICPPQSAVLNATSTVTGTTFAWSTGGTGPSITVSPLTTTTYTVTGTTPTGSSASALATVTVSTNILPTFTALGPYCAGATPATLPTTSLNSIIGTWNPATISTATAGTTTYTFTPNAGQCAVNTTMNVVVNPNITPTFNAIPAFCTGTTAPLLPTSSTNVPPITGTWSPATISNITSGTYTFTPSAGQCATTQTLNVTVSTQTVPNFAAIPDICAGSVAPILGTTSPNSVVGTWSPAIISNTTSGTYTFTPNAGQCATTQTLSVTVNPILVPNFAAIPTFCAGSAAPSLSTLSPNGILGTWNPALISNTTSGTYLFTPNAGLCASTQTLNVTVTPQTIPDFAAIPTFCVGDVAPTLGTTSPNGVVGTWNPATVDNMANGTYIFTPNSGLCATTQTLNATVLPPTVPTFAALPAFCSGTNAPTLGTTSLNGITGVWNPTTVDNTTSGTYTFTPNAGQCASTTTLNSTVNPIPTVVATALPTSICIGANSALIATGASTYMWTPINLPGTTVNVSPTTTTLYSVVGTSTEGCTNTAFVSVTISNEVILSFAVTPHRGCEPLTVQFNYVYDGLIDTNTLHWDFGDLAITDDTSNVLNPTYIYTHHGAFRVTLTALSTAGCNAIGYDSVFVIQQPVANFSADPSVTDTYLSNIHFYDESLNAYDWLWSFGDAGSNWSIEQFPEHLYTEPGIYPVMLVVHNNECEDTITKLVYILEGFAYFIPNSFTPNGNGMNDVFNGKGVGFRGFNFELSIYDRWGEKIFYTEDPNKGWDGKIAGKVCMGGVYAYKFKVTELNNIEHKYVGTVLLLR